MINNHAAFARQPVFLFCRARNGHGRGKATMPTTVNAPGRRS